MRIVDSKNDILRMNEIAKVLIKYGFKTLVQLIGIGKIPTFSSIQDIENDLTEDVHIRIRLVLQELGTTFIKLGQTLSTYPNIIGYDLAEELGNLQESAPVDDISVVREIIKSEFSQDIEEVFEEFSERPIASASIGQVHTAILNNKKVAIKVQHEGIESKVESDIRIMKKLAKRIDNRIESLKPYNLPAIVEVFERDIYKELNYTFEARNMIHLDDLLKNDDVYVPKVYLDYTTEKVLSMEFIEGVSLNTVLTDSSGKYNKEKIARVGADSFIKQILIYGFFHADPHPGNIFVLDRNKLVFIDFGMIGHVDDELKQNLAKLFIFISEGDAKLITKQLLYMEIIDNKDNYKNIEYEIIDLLDKYYGIQFDDISGILRELIENETLKKYGVVIPRDLLMVIRTISMIDDIGKVLDPEFNTTKIIKPYALRLISEKIKPKNVIKGLNEKYMDADHIITKFPDLVNDFFDVFEDGRLNLSLEYEDLRVFTGILSKISNQLSLALITAALLIGSSLIMMTDKGILLFDFPILGIIGFLFSMILGIVIIIMILRKGNY